MVAATLQLCCELHSSCVACCRSKFPRHWPYGLVWPLPIPNGPWSVSLRILLLIFHPPKVLILTFVNCFTKMTHFLPCTKTINSQEITILVMRAMFGYHCPPDEFINDRVHNSSLKFGNTCWNTCWGSSELMVSFSWAIICQDREREIDNWMESIIYIALMIDYKE